MNIVQTCTAAFDGRHPAMRVQDCVRVRSQMMRTSNKSLRVPYRSSPLTMLLRDSFDTEGAGVR